ncbi:MAG: prolyl oligopeptidase family serine peptidase [Acidobacteriota bacterium]
MMRNRLERPFARLLKRQGSWSLLAALWLVWAPVRVAGGEQDHGYLRPPAAVEKLFDRDKNYATLDYASPDGDHFLVPLTTELSTLEKMSEETHRLAMLEIRPRVNREWRLDTYGIDGLRLYSLKERSFRELSLPEGALVSDVMWSPDGQKIAFLAHLPVSTQVWVADVRSGKAEPLSDAPVMATLAGRPSFSRSASSPSRLLQWTPGGSVITLLVPADRGPEPQGPRKPTGPIIRDTRDKPTPTRTLPFLLRDERDEELFRYYTAAQLAELPPGGPPRKLGVAGMFLELSLSPDGKYLLTERIVEPLSHIVGYEDFPRRLEVRDLDGRILSTVRDLPLREDQSPDGGGVEDDLPRDVAWRPDGMGLGFLWRKKEDSPEGEAGAGDGKGTRDRILLLAPPFEMARAETLVEREERFSKVSYSPEGEYVFATIKIEAQGEGKPGERIVAYDLRSQRPVEHGLVESYDPEDVLQLPGQIFTRRTSNGILYGVLSKDRKHVYLGGPGYQESYEPRPFVDRVSIQSGEKERIFEGASGVYERPLVPLDSDFERMIIARESKTDFPDSFLWRRGAEAENLTRNQDPFPEITAAKRIDFEFTRRDGLAVQGRISLPVGYRDGHRVPAIFWTYPREYSSFEEYRQGALRSRNRNAFTHVSYLRWSDIWLSQGYALVYPDVPIIRKDDTYNDNYIQHLVDTLYAAIRKVDQMGYVDIDRMGHGGHSYGAFATANLLAHTPFFKAGIAGNGAYNRTLTPMGFQNEKRFIWDAEDLYLEMSPFFQADHIDTPLLLYHGADDNNSGTFPIQSERLMQALTGLGKTAVLYIYPYESHSPRAKETYLDLWSRWLAWFDRYVKNPEAPPVPTESGSMEK